jgi:integrase
MNDDVFTVEKASQIWLKRCQIDGLERSTLKSYREHVNLHVLPRIGQRDLCVMKTRDVHEFKDELLTDLTKAMAKKVLATFKAMVSEALSRDYIEVDFARAVKIKVSSRDVPKKRFPKKEEMKLLIDHVPSKHKALIVTAIYTGMRLSELRGLTWRHVLFDRSIIEVRQRADSWKEIADPKSAAGSRDIPMAPIVINELKQLKLTKAASDDDYVFSNGAGNVESGSNIYNRVFRPLMAECGLVDSRGKGLFTFHGLRHGAASLLIDAGWGPKKIQRFMGHSSINITFDVYGHLFDLADEDVGRMAELQSNLEAA